MARSRRRSRRYYQRNYVSRRSLFGTRRSLFGINTRVTRRNLLRRKTRVLKYTSSLYNPYRETVRRKLQKKIQDVPFKYRKPKLYKNRTIGIGFKEDLINKICIRRSVRKQVLHALNKTGKGKGKQKKRVLTKMSKIKCGG
jgi:hypothetical protein